MTWKMTCRDLLKAGFTTAPDPRSRGVTGAKPLVRSDFQAMSTRVWSKRWVMIACLAGMLVGVAGFTFDYAEGLSYLSNEPKACVNCHIMNDQFDSWRKGPHHAVGHLQRLPPAGAPSREVPRQGAQRLPPLDGLHLPAIAARAIRTQKLFFHEPIRIKPSNSQILQDNCLRCHGDLVHEVVRGSTWADDAIRCVHCHRGVGHGARELRGDHGQRQQSTPRRRLRRRSQRSWPSSRPAPPRCSSTSSSASRRRRTPS